MERSNKLVILIGVAILAIIIGVLVYSEKSPGKYDGFAQCLKDKGAIFYGAFWCPHCQNQKALFGKSAKFLPYVECSSPDGRSQLKICQDKKIDGYPTWIFADGERKSGEIALEELAEKTGCRLPQ